MYVNCNQRVKKLVLKHQVNMCKSSYENFIKKDVGCYYLTGEVLFPYHISENQSSKTNVMLFQIFFLPKTIIAVKL